MYFIWDLYLQFFFVTFGLATNNYFGAESKGGSESRLAKLLSKNNAIYYTSMDGRIFIKYRINVISIIFSSVTHFI